MSKLFSRMNRGWHGVSYILLLSLLLLSYTSCSEDDGTADEFVNWQERNDAVTDQWAASSMRKIRVYTQDDTSAGQNSDYIYVEVLEVGDGTDSPIFTDTARVAYRGKMIPTTNNAEGYVFDQTYLGDFSWHTAGMMTSSVDALVRGFTTALMNMHTGDRWRMHIPYQIGYNASSQGSLPAYSNLVFDIALLDYWHPGETRPAFRARMR